MSFSYNEARLALSSLITDYANNPVLCIDSRLFKKKIGIEILDRIQLVINGIIEQEYNKEYLFLMNNYVIFDNGMLYINLPFQLLATQYGIPCKMKGMNVEFRCIFNIDMVKQITNYHTKYSLLLDTTMLADKPLETKDSEKCSNWKYDIIERHSQDVNYHYTPHTDLRYNSVICALLTFNRKKVPDDIINVIMSCLYIRNMKINMNVQISPYFRGKCYELFVIVKQGDEYCTNINSINFENTVIEYNHTQLYYLNKFQRKMDMKPYVAYVPIMNYDKDSEPVGVNLYVDRPITLTLSAHDSDLPYCITIYGKSRSNILASH